MEYYMVGVAWATCSTSVQFTHSLHHNLEHSNTMLAWYPVFIHSRCLWETQIILMLDSLAYIQASIVQSHRNWIRVTHRKFSVIKASFSSTITISSFITNDEKDMASRHTVFEHLIETLSDIITVITVLVLWSANCGSDHYNVIIKYLSFILVHCQTVI